MNPTPTRENYRCYQTHVQSNPFCYSLTCFKDINPPPPDFNGLDVVNDLTARSVDEFRSSTVSNFFHSCVVPFSTVLPQNRNCGLRTAQHNFTKLNMNAAKNHRTCRAVCTACDWSKFVDVISMLRVPVMTC